MLAKCGPRGCRDGKSVSWIGTSLFPTCGDYRGPTLLRVLWFSYQSWQFRWLPYPVCLLSLPYPRPRSRTRDFFRDFWGLHYALQHLRPTRQLEWRLRGRTPLQPFISPGMCRVRLLGGRVGVSSEVRKGQYYLRRTMGFSRSKALFRIPLPPFIYRIPWALGNHFRVQSVWCRPIQGVHGGSAWTICLQGSVSTGCYDLNDLPRVHEQSVGCVYCSHNNWTMVLPSCQGLEYRWQLHGTPRLQKVDYHLGFPFSCQRPWPQTIQGCCVYFWK